MSSPYTSTSIKTTTPSAQCTSVRGTIRPQQNVVATAPTATAPTSSRNVDVVATVPTSYQNVATNVLTPELVETIEKKPSHIHNLLSSKVRFTHVVMKTAIWMKTEISLAVECFNAIHYNLLYTNVNDIDKLMNKSTISVLTLLSETSMSVASTNDLFWRCPSSLKTLKI